MTHIKSIINHPLLSIEPSFMFYPSPEPSPPKINNEIIRIIMKNKTYPPLFYTRLKMSDLRSIIDD